MAMKPNFLTSMGYHIFLSMVLSARAPLARSELRYKEHDKEEKYVSDQAAHDLGTNETDSGKQRHEETLFSMACASQGFHEYRKNLGSECKDQLAVNGKARLRKPIRPICYWSVHLNQRQD